MTGVTRQRAAEAVAALFGTSARQTHESTTYDPWEVIDRDGKRWRFVYDSSITATMRDGRRQIPATSGLYKVEMNSPKLSYEEMGKLQDVVRALRHAGAVVNSSCGMHVHVDASRHTPQSLKNALSIMYSKEDILFIYVPQMGDRDFYGTPLYYGEAPDIGVHEYQQGVLTDPTNYALQATVTANNEHSNFPATNINDGVYSQTSRWASQNSNLPIWLDMQFDDAVTVNRIVLTENLVDGWAGPRIASFELQTPAGDGAYTTILTHTGEIGDHKTIDFTETTTTNLRLQITGLTPDTTTHGQGATDPSIVELELYRVSGASPEPTPEPTPDPTPTPDPMENLLLEVPATANNEHSKFPASNINDGVNTQQSRWAAANSSLPMWIEFDFGEGTSFNTLVLKENIVANWASERITGFELQKEDGNTYTTFFTYSGTVGAEKEFSFDVCTTQKLRLVITSLQADTTVNSAGQTDPSLCEVELYYRPVTGA